MDNTIKTCRWFNAADFIAEKMEADFSDTYPYNKHLKYPNCWSVERARSEFGKSPDACSMMCPMSPDEFRSCNFYHPEEPKILKIGYIQNDEEYYWFALDKIRLNYGTVEYRVISWNQDSELFNGFQNNAVVCASINSMNNPHDHLEIAFDILHDAIESIKQLLHTQQDFTLVDLVDGSKTSYSDFILSQR